MWSEIETTLSRNWTWAKDSIYYNDNHYSTSVGMYKHLPPQYFLFASIIPLWKSQTSYSTNEVEDQEKLSEFLRQSLTNFIIKGFRTIVFIFIVISTTFRPICPPTFFRCLSNSGTYTELRTTTFIESTGVACSDSVSHNQVQVLRIPVLLLACSQDWTCNLQMIVSLEA